jgi:hypothetical protein
MAVDPLYSVASVILHGLCLDYSVKNSFADICGFCLDPNFRELIIHLQRLFFLLLAYVLDSHAET